MRIRLQAPPGFSFRRTVRSHGWCLLPPFELDGSHDALATTVALPEGGAARVELSMENETVLLETSSRASVEGRRHLAAAARRVLGLDRDLGPFHAAVREDPAFRWIAEKGVGRLLRSP